MSCSAVEQGCAPQSRDAPVTWNGGTSVRTPGYVTDTARKYEKLVTFACSFPPTSVVPSRTIHSPPGCALASLSTWLGCKVTLGAGICTSTGCAKDPPCGVMT